MKDTGGPAFPFNGTHAFSGMTLREYAAIHLKIPDSGNDWIDEMIRKSNHIAQRNYFAAKASPEFIGFSTPESGARAAYEWANAMLAKSQS